MMGGYSAFLNPRRFAIAGMFALIIGIQFVLRCASDDSFKCAIGGA